MTTTMTTNSVGAKIRGVNIVRLWGDSNPCQWRPGTIAFRDNRAAWRFARYETRGENRAVSCLMAAS